MQPSPTTERLPRTTGRALTSRATRARRSPSPEP
jgi:hypothetical protein